MDNFIEVVDSNRQRRIVNLDYVVGITIDHACKFWKGESLVSEYEPAIYVRLTEGSLELPKCFIETQLLIDRCIGNQVKAH